ncbi:MULTISPECIES: histidine kinase [unclassified Crossiella]|uniref:sensor histidine kinase n=1 Tax=unclassified Crossiella TaxID=2620835 RepID=UPI001FFF622D|nr:MULTISPECIES: histidine kinase [unclassified Crossiella]MCK2244002.1 histidine kinase [Crossiella sp. S99.2]MCK2257140.1 histidine kinase [Crossiella sp. S99.1]
MQKHLRAGWRVLVTARDAEWGPPVAGLPGPLWVRRAIVTVLFLYLTAANMLTWGQLFVTPVAAVFVLAHLLPWLLSRRSPLTAWRLAMGVLVLLTVVSTPLQFPRILIGIPNLERPWSMGALALIPAIYQAAARAPRQYRLPIGVITVGLTTLAGAVPLGGASDSLFPPLFALAAVLAGVSRSQLRATESELAWVRRDMAEEQARSAVLAERTRIARELHDIIAHHLSMIAVRTDSAPYRLSISDDKVREELAQLGDAARQALSETRGLLGVLRAEDAGPELAPQPTLGELPGLVAAASDSGVAATLTVEGEPRPVPAAVGLAVYRVTQEALSNARRHSPGGAVQVWLRHLPDGLHLVVDNDPGAEPAGETGPGNGITGMRERIGIVGGAFQAGPRPDGGYTVRASIPLAGNTEGAA